MDFVEQEVEPPRDRGALARLILSLVGAGLLAGLILLGVGWAVGTFAQTEEGGCRTLPAACTSLSLASVEQFSGVDLPEGATVTSAYYQHLGDTTEFRAEVMLPAGTDPNVLVPPYELLPGEWPDTVPALEGRALENVQYWWMEEGDGGNRAAATGESAEGLVVLFDTRT